VQPTFINYPWTAPRARPHHIRPERPEKLIFGLRALKEKPIGGIAQRKQPKAYRVPRKLFICPTEHHVIEKYFKIFH